MKKSSGQSMVEYLIIITLVSVATIGIVKIISHTIRAKFAQVTYAIQGRKLEEIRNIEFKNIKKDQYEIIGTENFYETLE